MYSPSSGDGASTSVDGDEPPAISSSQSSSNVTGSNISGLPNSPLSNSNSSTTNFDSMTVTFKSALDEFRDNWEHELKNAAVTAMDTDPESSEDDSDDTIRTKSNENLDVSNKNDQQQTIAESLFRKGVELEQCGKVYDAITFYKKAVQIVPDIEFKFYETSKKNASSYTKRNNNNIQKLDSPPSSDNIDNSVYSTRELASMFHMDLAKLGKFILNSRDEGVISTELHISELPMEILIYIMRWVVSMDLDLRSLEQCAAVCKGFYICARDNEIWRHACLKVWGPSLGIASESFPNSSSKGYNSWRQMFIERERVHFHGCYISKTTYVRMGENSFQDQYYRPMQLIEYYRYIRFMPDGRVFMMTSSDEPAQGVVKMKMLSQQRPDILRGTYHLHGDTITIVLKKYHRVNQTPTHHSYGRQGRRNSNDASEIAATTYCIEFGITSTPRRKFCQLQWKHYSINQIRNKIETNSEFELSPSKYPPLWFSVVRSYHLEADSPLKG